jgi:hypothetical protein
VDNFFQWLRREWWRGREEEKKFLLVFLINPLHLWAILLGPNPQWTSDPKSWG